MKCQPKQNMIKLISYLFLLILALGCNSENRQKGYFLVNYYYTHDDLAIMRLCKIDNYNLKKSLHDNLKNINTLKCFEIPFPEWEYNYKYIKQLRGIRKKSKFADILCRVDFETTDANALLYIRSDSVKFDSFTIKYDYYHLPLIRDMVIFHHFEPIEHVVLK